MCVCMYLALARWYEIWEEIQFTFLCPALPPWALPCAICFKPQMKKCLFFLFMEGRLVSQDCCLEPFFMHALHTAQTPTQESGMQRVT